MKRKLSLLSSVLFVLVIMPVNAKELIFASYEGAPPSTYKNDQGEMVGITVDIANEIGKRLAIPIKTKIYPRNRIAEILVKGDAHIMEFMIPAWLPKTKDKLNWSIPFLSEKDFFVVHKDSGIEINSYSDFNGYKIGTRRGFFYSQKLTKLFENNSVKRVDVDTYEQLYKMLLLKRIDIIIASSFVTEYFIKQDLRFKENFTIQTLVDSSHELQFPCSKNMPIALEDLNRVLTEIEKDNTLDKILAKYGIIN